MSVEAELIPSPEAMPGAAPTAPVRDRIGGTFLVTAIAATLVMFGLFARVAQLQIQPPAQLGGNVGERFAVTKEPGSRGEIVDRRGRLLAATQFAYRVIVDPAVFPTPVEPAIGRLADVLKAPYDTLARRIAGAMSENERWSAEQAEWKEQQAAEAREAKQDPGGARVIGASSTTTLNYSTKPASRVRYLPVSEIIDHVTADAVTALKIKGVSLELRPVRHATEPSLTEALLGKVGYEHTGLGGVELTLDRYPKPVEGKLVYVRDAFNRPLWVEEGGYVPAQRGGDIQLSIDIELQRIAQQELEIGIKNANSAGGRCIVVDPRTGEILAMVDIVRRPKDAVEYPWNMAPEEGPRRRYITIMADDGSSGAKSALLRNRCLQDAYEPGSTFKPFWWSVTTELGLADPNERVNTEDGVYQLPYGKRKISDVTPKPNLSWAEVLVYSSNIGMAKVTSRMSPLQQREATLRFGFGQRTGIELAGESAGIVTSLRAWSKYTQTSVAMGHEIAVTPIQMAHAFCAFARTGELAGTLCDIRITARDPEQSGEVITRVLTSRIANLTRETMRRVAQNADQKQMERAAAAHKKTATHRYELFGKSGTAEIPLGKPPAGKKRPAGTKGYYPNQYNSSFIAGAPAESPRLVVLVVIDDPGPDRVASRTHYGSAVAFPVVQEIMERSLSYLGVPPSYDEKSPDPARRAPKAKVHEEEEEPADDQEH